MRFVANLREETIDAFLNEEIQPAAYLLSTHRVGETTLSAARRVRELGLPLIADNGTKPLIDDVIEEFKPRASAVSQHVKEIRRELGHVPRGREIPEALRETASALAQQVVHRCVSISENVDADQLVETQLSMDPTHLVAQEDFATACLIGLDLERETTGWSVSRFETRNRRSLRLWERVRSDPRCRDRAVYAVLSAMDYNTGRAAGRLAAQAGVEHAAIGLAGVNLDQSATDFYVIGTATFRLEKPVVRRYLRLSQIVTGLSAGYRDSGSICKSFHCLGLGAPVTLPIVGAAFATEVALTTDSTSPIHEAVKNRVLYHPLREGDRMSTIEITEDIVRGQDWPFLSPFAQTFRDRFGHDVKQAERWWSSQGQPEITRALLEHPSDLTQAIPMFADADPALLRTVRETRIANNHWVADHLAQAFSGPSQRELAMAALKRVAERDPTVTTKGIAAVLKFFARLDAR